MLFLESPWPILIAGLFIEAALAIALFRTGRGALLWAIGGVALIVLLGVLIESRTVTDAKLVRRTLDAAAAGLQANNAKQVFRCIVPGPDGDAARDKTAWALSVAEFEDISIRNLEVHFNYQTSPYTVEATFTALVRGKDRSGDLGEQFQPVAIMVKLRKESGRWLVYGEPRHDAHE